MAHESKGIIRKRVHKRIRRKVAGSTERPRLAVFRRVKHIYTQVIDDTVGHTLAAASSNEKSGIKSGGNVAGAKAVKGNGGKLILLSPDEYVRDVLNTAGIDLVMPIMFDRNDAIAAVRQ